jgi:ADP-ribosylglycohydrolase
MDALPNSPEERLARARVALEGLATGDALGPASIVIPTDLNQSSARIGMLERVFRYTDDTQMALSIVEVLRRHDAVEQDDLADSFATHFESGRGYGPGMLRLLPQLQRGRSWQSAAKDLFGGQGSFGNGSAMRVAPLGAYFADDLGLTVEHARRAAEVTHAHHEGAAGAIAVAVASALAWRQHASASPIAGQDFIDAVLTYVPTGEVHAGLQAAQRIPAQTDVSVVTAQLGNGSRVSAQDTVPFVLWCAAHHLADFPEAIRTTAEGRGDVDTTCAIVGGIVASYTGLHGIPVPWLQVREPLPDWPFAAS